MLCVYIYFISIFLLINIFCLELFFLSLNTDKVYKAISFNKYNNEVKAGNKKVFDN